MRQTCGRSTAPKYGSCARRQYRGPHNSIVRYTYSAFTVHTSLSFVPIFHIYALFSIHLSTCWPSTTAATPPNESVRTEHMQANGLRCTR